MSALPILVFSLIGVGVAVAAYLGYRADQKRRALLQNFALGKGWTYTARDDSWCDRFTGTPFGTGDNRKATNVLHGPYDDTDMVAFDYSYETTSSDGKGHSSKTTHRFAVCALRLKAPLPGVELTPESALTRLAGHLGFEDLQLESEDFNRHYRVRTRDPKLAYDVLNPRTMAALLARPAVHMRLLDLDAVSWDGGHMTPVGLLSRLSTLQVLIDGIPSFVWADHSVERPPGGASA